METWADDIRNLTLSSAPNHVTRWEWKANLHSLWNIFFTWTWTIKFKETICRPENCPKCCSESICPISRTKPNLVLVIRITQHLTLAACIKWQNNNQTICWQKPTHDQSTRTWHGQSRALDAWDCETDVERAKIMGAGTFAMLERRGPSGQADIWVAISWKKWQKRQMARPEGRAKIWGEFWGLKGQKAKLLGPRTQGQGPKAKP